MQTTRTVGSATKAIGSRIAMLMAFVPCVAAAAADTGEAIPDLRAAVPSVSRPAASEREASPAVLAQGSRDELFGIEKPASDPSAKPGAPSSAPAGRGWTGFFQQELAYMTPHTAHWANVLTRLQLGRQGRFGDDVKWKIGARLDYDAAYRGDHEYYPIAVRRDQLVNFSLRENYIDFPAAGWDFRVGRQHIIWGEVVGGLFFADAVSAKDLRQFILPEFEILRIPQWAVRSEYSKGDFHADLIWVPVASYNKIGKPGADFFSFPPVPANTIPVFQNEELPRRTLANSNYGARMSLIKKGWDVSGFYYRSMDQAATFFREVVPGPVPVLVYKPRHERIWQAGGTVAKDFESFVFKAELLYTDGRKYGVTRLSDSDGVVAQNTVDYVIALDFNLPRDTRLNTQVFQRIYFNHDPDIVSRKYETGGSILVNNKIAPKVEVQLLAIQSFNRWNDRLVRPRIDWFFEKNWRLRFGVDIFSGPATGLFGQYNARDRVYSELRYDF